MTRYFACNFGYPSDLHVWMCVCVCVYIYIVYIYIYIYYIYIYIHIYRFASVSESRRCLTSGKSWIQETFQLQSRSTFICVHVAASFRFSLYVSHCYNRVIIVFQTPCANCLLEYTATERTAIRSLHEELTRAHMCSCWRYFYRWSTHAWDQSNSNGEHHDTLMNAHGCSYTGGRARAPARWRNGAKERDWSGVGEGAQPIQASAHHRGAAPGGTWATEKGFIFVRILSGLIAESLLCACMPILLFQICCMHDLCTVSCYSGFGFRFKPRHMQQHTETRVQTHLDKIHEGTPTRAQTYSGTCTRNTFRHMHKNTFKRVRKKTI